MMSHGCYRAGWLWWGCLLLLGGWPLAGHAQEPRAGAAVIDITPPIGFPMWGYAARHDAPSEGVLDPLKARAVVLEVGDQRLAIVSLDLGRAPTRQSTVAIRARIQRDARIDHVLLVASHTHHGPVLELDDWPTPQAPYVRSLETKLGDVIVAAAKELKPARLGIASKEVALNRNRHSKRADAPVDRELLVLRLEDADGKPIAHLVNFAAHAVLQDSKGRKFSADFPGVLASVVEKELGGQCLFLQGAAGDLSPYLPNESGPEKFGQALAREVLALAGKIRCAANKAPSLRIDEEEFTFKPRLDLGNPLIKAALGFAFFPRLVAFYEQEYRPGVRPQLTVALLDGQIGLVGVSGEFFCGQALHLKRRARLEHLLFLGYCNDYQQYFPTIEAVTEKGYGTDAPVAPAELGAGERMMDRALIHLQTQRGLLKEVPPRKAP
ncbi:MAG: neutral/alkaline non-lysosomal ceramidase N-terminal domain-containing protein [Planctomycetia bacterium]|nr:neutral/alkaline non-lysosomal ceramidase N-terminal domain-containing protein [Planctomycetia bacterium]